MREAVPDDVSVPPPEAVLVMDRDPDGVADADADTDKESEFERLRDTLLECVQEALCVEVGDTDCVHEREALERVAEGEPVMEAERDADLEREFEGVGDVLCVEDIEAE
eukprot:TRINITY_DN16010_c0_g1_i1.p3 TRINITY_DN16010_c0_g1~~TRINITY_DN16010_c0_g1_i1.p3  ORF type:complete len:109 (+),score=35.31 TRINITY_DN16010_c0_g1_i1:1339-1665(+)